MRLLCLIVLLSAGCSEPEPTPPTRYVPDGRGDPGDAVRRIPGERPGGEIEPGEPPPPHWECHPLFYNHDGSCDCGCGIPDPDCDEPGCATPGCDAAGCDFCHVNGGIEYTCGGTSPPVGWTCRGYYYSDNECDCGCSLADPDCNGGGCMAPGCSHPDCLYCWDGESSVDCNP